MAWLRENDDPHCDCQPCGGCNWCLNNWKARRVAQSLNRRVPAIEQKVEYVINSLVLNDPEFDHPETRNGIRKLREVLASLRSAQKA